MLKVIIADDEPKVNLLLQKSGFYRGKRVPAV